MTVSNPQDNATIIGFFSDAWDAQAAVEDLKFAGYDQRLRYIQNGHHPQHDSSKEKPTVSGFMARIYGFADEGEYKDSRDNWTVNPEAEDYFLEAFERKNHVILIQANQDGDHAIEILRKHHGKVEEQTLAFFAAASDDPNRVLESNSRNIASNYHQTAGIEPPRGSGSY